MTSELFARRIHEDEPGHAKEHDDDPLADRVEDAIQDGAVGDEAGELVHDPLDPRASHRNEPFYRLVDRLANEPEDDEARQDDRGVDSEAEHARVHAEEVTRVAAEELVAERLLQLVSNEALVRDGQRRQEEREGGEERDEVRCRRRSAPVTTTPCSRAPSSAPRGRG